MTAEEKCEARTRVQATGDKPHCFCLKSSLQHGAIGHQDMKCCWCGESKCFSWRKTPVPGHGPLRFEITWE